MIRHYFHQWGILSRRYLIDGCKAEADPPLGIEPETEERDEETDEEETEKDTDE